MDLSYSFFFSQFFFPDWLSLLFRNFIKANGYSWVKLHTYISAIYSRLLYACIRNQRFCHQVSFKLIRSNTTFSNWRFLMKWADWWEVNHWILHYVTWSTFLNSNNLLEDTITYCFFQVHFSKFHQWDNRVSTRSFFYFTYVEDWFMVD